MLERLQELDALLERSPEDVDLRVEAARRLAYLGRHAEAVPHWRAITECHPEHAWARYSLAQAQGRSGDWSAALETIEGALERGQVTPHTVAMHARALSNGGRSEEALAETERALALGAESELRAWIHEIQGDVSSDQGLYVDAEALYRQALEENLQNLSALRSLAGVTAQLRDFEAALSAARHLVERVPQEGESWYRLGYAAAGLGRWETSREALARALELAYDTASTRMELASALLKLHQPADALEHARAGIGKTEEPARRAYGLHLVALAHRELGDGPAELTALTEAVESDPKNAHARYHLGYRHLHDGEPARGLKHLEAAAALEPERAERWYALGKASAEAGEDERARKALNRALRLGYHEPTVQRQLADVCLRSGRAEAAVTHAKRALALTRDPGERPRLLQLLAEASARIPRASGSKKSRRARP